MTRACPFHVDSLALPSARNLHSSVAKRGHAGSCDRMRWFLLSRAIRRALGMFRASSTPCSKVPRASLRLCSTRVGTVTCGRARCLSKQIDAFNPAWIAEDGGFERYRAWLALRERESRAMDGLAVKLRLTNQSRYTPATAQRQAQSPFGFIDAEGRMKPWQNYV